MLCSSARSDQICSCPLSSPANRRLESTDHSIDSSHFDWLHTLHSAKLARRLSDHRPGSAEPLRVLLQVNVARDPDKFGLPPDAVFDMAETLLQADYPGIALRGLMTIGQRRASDDQRRAEFSMLRKLADDCTDRFGARYFTELSMGMSEDFEIAIEEGATMIRVGSAIFGPRTPSSHAD